MEEDNKWILVTGKKVSSDKKSPAKDSWSDCKNVGGRESNCCNTNKIIKLYYIDHYPQTKTNTYFNKNTNLYDKSIKKQVIIVIKLSYIT